MNWKNFLAGLIVGIIVTASLLYLVGDRYHVSSSGPDGRLTVKIDTWTGKSWVMQYYVREGSRTWHWVKIEQQ